MIVLLIVIVLLSLTCSSCSSSLLPHFSSCRRLHCYSCTWAHTFPNIYIFNANGRTYRERGEGQAHAPEAIESQGDEDEDREFYERQRTREHESAWFQIWSEQCVNVHSSSRLTIRFVGSVSDEETRQSEACAGNRWWCQKHVVQYWFTLMNNKHVFKRMFASTMDVLFKINNQYILSCLLTCPAVAVCEVHIYPWRFPAAGWWLRAGRSPRWTPGSASHPGLCRSASRSSSWARPGGPGASSPPRLRGQRPRRRKNHRIHRAATSEPRID